MEALVSVSGILSSGSYSISIVLLICALFQAGAASPSQDASKIVLRGMVVDHVGAVMGHVGVEITNSDTAATSKLETDQQGQFSVALAPGAYKLCVSRFPTSCRDVMIGQASAPDYLVLKAKHWEETVDPTLPESRFQKIAGLGAQNCGRVKVKEDRRPATACAMQSFRHHKPFFVIYGEMGIDSSIASGMAWNGSGDPYFVSYDSMGLDGGTLLGGESMPDGSHTFVRPCSLPLRLYVNEESELDCFKNKEVLEQQIERGDYRSVGDAGYKEMIPPLKARLQDPEILDDPEQQQEIKLALAKLGDRHQQQALVCELRSADSKEMEALATDKLPYVGGWLMIRLYREMLIPTLDPGSSAARRAPKNRDATTTAVWR